MPRVRFAHGRAVDQAEAQGAASATRTRTSTAIRDTGISVYFAPSVKPGQLSMYFDPLHQLSTHPQRRWGDPTEQAEMIAQVLKRARRRMR